MMQPNSVFVSAPNHLAGATCDRRAHPRIRSARLPLTNVRISSVGPGSVIDLSAGGALLDLSDRVRPESRFALQLETPVERVELPFQVLRCYVVALDNRGPIYRVAGMFDSPLDVQGLTRRASSAVRQLIATIERLRAASQKSAPARGEAAFSEILAGVAAWLRRGDSIDLVAVKVKAQLTYQYPSLRILTTLQPRADDLTAVGGFGLTLKSRHQLSSHDRRFLRAHAQLLALLEDARRAFAEETDAQCSQPADVVCSPAKWVAPQASGAFAH